MQGLMRSCVAYLQPGGCTAFKPPWTFAAASSGGQTTCREQRAIIALLLYSIIQCRDTTYVFRRKLIRGMIREMLLQHLTSSEPAQAQGEGESLSPSQLVDHRFRSIATSSSQARTARGCGRAGRHTHKHRSFLVRTLVDTLVSKGKLTVTCPDGAIGPNATDITCQPAPSPSLNNRDPETQNRDGEI